MLFFALFKALRESALCSKAATQINLTLLSQNAVLGSPPSLHNCNTVCLRLDVNVCATGARLLEVWIFCLPWVLTHHSPPGFTHP